jgi:hypothetical protein
MRSVECSSAAASCGPYSAAASSASASCRAGSFSNEERASLMTCCIISSSLTRPNFAGSCRADQANQHEERGGELLVGLQ